MRILDAIKPYAVFLGMGLYWGWIALVFYSDAIFPFAHEADEMVNTFWLWATMSHACMLIVHTVAARRFGSLLCRSFFLIGSIAGMCFGAIAMILLTSDVFQESTALSSAVFGVIAIVVGLSSSWHVLLWGESYAAVPLDRVPLLSLFSIMIGLGFYFAVAPFIPLVRAGVVVLLPLFSGLCIVLVKNQINKMAVGVSDSTASRPVENESTMSPSSRFVLYAPLVTSLFAFAFCGEMLRVFSTELTNESLNQTGSLYLLGGLAGLAVLAVYFLASNDAGKPRAITLGVVRVTLLVMAAAFLVAPFIGAYSYAISYGVFGAGFWCIRAISWMMCFFLCARTSVSPIRAVAVMDAAFALAVVASGQVNSWITEFIRIGTTQITTVCLVTVFMLMLIAIVVLGGKAASVTLGKHDDAHFDSTDGLPNDDAGRSSDGSTFFINEFGLTPRESEVAALLARGRNLPFIQERLYISAGTVNSHLRHIYKKMGVHSRQEFIDVVEERMQNRP